MQKGDKVAVYADIKNTCLKGRVTKFDDMKLFVGNGRTVLSRTEIFQSSEPLQ